MLLRVVLPAASKVTVYQELLMLCGHSPLTIAPGKSAPHLLGVVGKIQEFANTPISQKKTSWFLYWERIAFQQVMYLREKKQWQENKMCVYVYTHILIYIHILHIHTWMFTEKRPTAPIFSRASFIQVLPDEYFIPTQARPRPLISTLQPLMILVQFSLPCGLDTPHYNSNCPKHHSKHEVITFLPKCKWLSTGDSFWERRGWHSIALATSFSPDDHHWR